MAGQPLPARPVGRGWPRLAEAGRPWELPRASSGAGEARSGQFWPNLYWVVFSTKVIYPPTYFPRRWRRGARMRRPRSSSYTRRLPTPGSPSCGSTASCRRGSPCKLIIIRSLARSFVRSFVVRANGGVKRSRPASRMSCDPRHTLSGFSCLGSQVLCKAVKYSIFSVRQSSCSRLIQRATTLRLFNFKPK